MKPFRAILSGSLVWILVLSVFLVFGFIPALKDSQIQQGLIIGILIIPFATLGATVYYKKGDQTNGLTIAVMMVLTALGLDAVITVPFFEIPYNGGSYSKFFTDPLLWVLVVENMTVIYFYWRWKAKPIQKQAV